MRHKGKDELAVVKEQGVRWRLKCRSYLSPMWSSPLHGWLRIFFGDDPHGSSRGAQAPPNLKPRAGGGIPIPHGGGGMPEHPGHGGAGGMSPETVSGSGWVVVAGCSLQCLEAKLQAGKKSLKPFLSWCLQGLLSASPSEAETRTCRWSAHAQLPRANRVPP